MYRINASFAMAPKVNASQTPQPSFAAAEHRHPSALAPATLSLNSRLALDQFEIQPDGHQQLLALLVRNGITDGALQIQSSQGAEVNYQQEVDTPNANSIMGERQRGNLIVRAKLNEQSQYDILDIHFHIPSSGERSSINLRSGPPANISNCAPAHVNEDDRFSHLAAYYSQRGFMPPSMGRADDPRAKGTVLYAGHSHVSTRGLTNFPDSMAFTASVGRGSKARVPDPENLGKMVFRHTLHQRTYTRVLVPDPEHPGEMTTRGALAKRASDRKQVRDPNDSAKTISLKALRDRVLLRQVADPENPGFTTSQKALTQRQYDRRQVAHPNNPGKTISQSALSKQVQVADLNNPGEMITRNVRSQRTLVEDPQNPEGMIF